MQKPEVWRRECESYYLLFRGTTQKLNPPLYSTSINLSSQPQIDAREAGKCRTTLCPGRKGNEIGQVGQSLPPPISYKEQEIPGQSKSPYVTSAGDLSPLDEFVGNQTFSCTSSCKHAQNPSVISLHCFILLCERILSSTFNLTSLSTLRPMARGGYMSWIDSSIFPHSLRIRGQFREGHVIQGEHIGLLS